MLSKVVITLTLLALGLVASAPVQAKPIPAHAKSLPDAGTKRLVQVPISDAPSYAKRALVVGVTDYALCNPLHVCGNDAKEFADFLKTRFGFTDVTLMTDEPGTPAALKPTGNNLKRALHQLLQGVVPGKSEVVLFYSGHGVRLGSDSDWLVPEDGDPQDVSHTCVNYTQIVQALNTARPKRAFLVTDACRSLLAGKGAGGSGFGKSLKSISLGPEVAEMQSCQPTEVSQEGMAADFPESVFTHFLVKGLEGDPEALADGTKTVTFDSLKEYVQGKVSGYVTSHFNSSQVPDGRATLGGMVLARVDALPQGDTPPPPFSPPAPVVSPQPVNRPLLTPEQQQQANEQLLNAWENADGTHNIPKGEAMTVAMVQQALDAGADVNAKDSSNSTTLMGASFVGKIDVVRLLLDKGADVNIITHESQEDKHYGGSTALMFAALNGHADVMRLLIDKGADVNGKKYDGSTPLMLGVGYADAVTLLLNRGAKINARDRIGRGTALMRAAMTGQTNVVKLMIEKGADVNIADGYQKTALTYALENNHADVAALLRAAGAQ